MDLGLGSWHRRGCPGPSTLRTSHTRPPPSSLQNATLRDNILMGAPLEQGRYDAVLDACALRPDLEMLPAGACTALPWLRALLLAAAGASFRVPGRRCHAALAA